MACMPTHSLPSATACGGIGAITLMAGADILTMVGDGTAGTVRAGDSAGAGEAGTAVAGGDTIIITTIIPDIILVAAIGAADIGTEAVYIPIAVLRGRPILPGMAAVPPVVLQMLSMEDRLYAVAQCKVARGLQDR